MSPCSFPGFHSEKSQDECSQPSRLVILAAIGLLRDEPSAISALEYLPRELYPPLFMAAIFGRRRETLKAMVPALALCPPASGGLMQKPHQEPYKQCWMALMPACQRLPQVSRIQGAWQGLGCPGRSTWCQAGG